VSWRKLETPNLQLGGSEGAEIKQKTRHRVGMFLSLVNLIPSICNIL